MADVKGKADSWREEHLAVIAFICQEFFRLMEQIEHSIFLPCAAMGLVFSRSAAKQRFKAVSMR